MTEKPERVDDRGWEEKVWFAFPLPIRLGVIAFIPIFLICGMKGSFALGIALGVLVPTLVITAYYNWERIKHRVMQRPTGRKNELPEIAESLGFRNLFVMKTRRDKKSQSWEVRLDRFAGKTAKDLVGKREALEMALRATPGLLRVIPSRRRADLCEVRMLLADPLANPIPWVGSKMRSVTDHMILGHFEDGSNVDLHVVQDDDVQHILIGGVTGSGKSSLLNVILANLATCPDLAVWGIDLKGGAEFLPWQQALDRVASNEQDAASLLKDAKALIPTRMEDLVSRGKRKWIPDQEHPLLLIVIDELASLDDEALGLVATIAQKGRAAGIALILATQRPSSRMLSTDRDSGLGIRGQMQTRICMRVKESSEVDMILGGGRRLDGYTADRTLLEKGTFYLDDDKNRDPLPARAFYMDDTAVQLAVSQTCFSRVSPDDAVPPDQNASETPQETPGEANRAKVKQAVEQAGEAGIGQTEIARQLNLGRTTVYRALKALGDAGLALPGDDGKWRAVPPVSPKSGNDPADLT